MLNIHFFCEVVFETWLFLVTAETLEVRDSASSTGCGFSCSFCIILLLTLSLVSLERWYTTFLGSASNLMMVPLKY